VARDENHLLMSADYSQIELRLMAAFSGDEAMIQAFRDGVDIHRDTASRVYNIMPMFVTDEQRSKCKMVNFGIIYGISAFGLSQRLKISRKEASDLIETYFKLYPKVKEYMSAAISSAREKGYAQTILGRRRTLKDISSRNATVRQAAERDAVNTPIQGSAADLIKVAMVKIDKRLKEECLRTKMVLRIHDELLFDVPKDEVERVKEIVREEMTHAIDVGVPLEVGIGVADNWLAAH
jgi:DNA polymerase-1